MATSPMPYTSPSPVGRDVFEQLAHPQSLLTAADVTRRLTIKQKTVYAHAARDLIPHYRIQTSLRFPAKDIAESLAQPADPPGTPTS